MFDSDPSAQGLCAQLSCPAGSPRLLHQLPDTVAFLQLLRCLAAPLGSTQDGPLPPALQISAAAAAATGEELPEVRAARVLFRCAARLQYHIIHGVCVSESRVACLGSASTASKPPAQVPSGYWTMSGHVVVG